MNIALCGLGVQGSKRKALLDENQVFTIDPVNTKANYKTLGQAQNENFEAVFICTPDSEKFALLMESLSLGKHVLIEKPLHLSREEFLMARNLSKAKNLTIYEAYNHRFEPHIMSVKRALDNSLIGDIYRVRVFYGNGTARLVKQSSWRDSGDGVLTDLGSHLCDLLLYFFGKRNFKVDYVNREKLENLSPDYVLTQLSEKFTVLMEMSLLNWKNTFTLEIIGSNGSIHVDGLCKWGPSVLTIRKRILPSGVPEENIEILEMSDPTWEAEAKHFFNLVASRDGGNLENSEYLTNLMNAITHYSRDSQCL